MLVPSQTEVFGEQNPEVGGAQFHTIGFMFGYGDHWSPVQ